MHPAPNLPDSRHALVVATATYTDPALRELRAPARDAADIVEVLAAPSIGGFTVTRVLDRREYEIRRAVEAFLAHRGVDDLVLIYLSCHGVLDPRGRLHLAATDTVSTQLSSTAIESTWLHDRLEECRARRQVLILDCCFSGSFGHAKGGDQLDLERRFIGRGRGRAVLTATRAGEPAFEGAGLSEASQRSVFTAALVDGLRTGEADKDGDGYISVDEAYAYAADQVKAASEAQSPQRWLHGGEGEIILARSPRGLTVTPAELPEALRLSLDSPYPEIRRAAITTLSTWLTSPDPRETLAAQQTLQLMASQDTPSVAASARALLHPEQPSPTAAPPPTADRPSQDQAAHAADTAQAETVPQRCLLTVRVQSGLPWKKVVSAVAFSPDGCRVATVGSDRKARLWNPATGEAVGQPLTGHSRWVFAVAFSPDGLLLATGSADTTVRLWNPTTGEPIGQPLTSHTGTVNGMTFTPDGDLLIAAEIDGKTLRLWNANLGRPVGQPLTEHSGTVQAVAFSPDGRLLATGHARRVRLWDANTGLPVGQPLTGHTGTVHAVAFSPQSHLLATGSYDRQVRLWDANTGLPVGQPLTDHTGTVHAVAFSPNGNLFATAGNDGVLRLWTQ